ncbi:MAG TPA: DUF1501 domain-containing protein [Planctomycetota bacterium]|nr:DUF1501 domain-containing protein [Planctomycetota bacterium]
MTRRQSLGALGGFLGLALGRPAFARTASARSVILVWLGGGPSQFETWDPKVGRESGGPTRDVATNVPGVRIAEHLAETAKVMDKISIIRSMTGKEGDHDRGTYYAQTGYVPGPFVHPSVGSIVAREMGDPASDLPGYVALSITPVPGQGFLPAEFAPLRVRPGQPIPNVGPPRGFDPEAFRARLQLIRASDAAFRRDFGAEEATAHWTGVERADRLMRSPLLKAFDYRQEPVELVRSYGADLKNTNGHFYGPGCLIARRLVESGVRFVQVSVQNLWDHHKGLFDHAPGALRLFDLALSGLVRDLDRRGLLESTLVVCMGEFGRTPRINPDGGRDHYPKAWSLALAGGGIRGGRVIGSTDRDGVEVTDRPVTVPDVLATLYACLGIDPGKKIKNPVGARHALTDHGTPVRELLD